MIGMEAVAVDSMSAKRRRRAQAMDFRGVFEKSRRENRRVSASHAYRGEMTGRLTSAAASCSAQ